MKPIVAIIGRPNVGKSTLFNRLIGRRQAITEDRPGVTRDRNYGTAHWGDRSFILVDTGGFEPEAADRLRQQVQEQVEAAIAEADLILFLMDGQEGLMPADQEVAAYLRRVEKPVFYAVNKIDGQKREEGVFDFYRLGVERLYPISAEHGRGVGDLLDDLVQALPPSPPPEEEESEEIRVAIVGRPNVGKSSLLNRLLGRSRAIVDSTPGTTRDAVDTPLVRNGKRYLLIDTAGIRRRSRVAQRLEKYAVLKALRSLERCQVALVLLDGFEGLTDQDARILDFAAETGRALILVVNKWDLVQKDSSTQEVYRARLQQGLKTLDYVPVLFISALSGQRVEKIFGAIDEVMAEYRKRIPTADLNQWLREALQRLPPPLHRNRPVKIYYASQVSAAPPSFVLFTNAPTAIPESYRRYLARKLRERYGFRGTPLRLLFRQRESISRRS